MSNNARRKKSSSVNEMNEIHITGDTSLVEAIGKVAIGKKEVGGDDVGVFDR